VVVQDKPKPKFGRWEDEPESGGWDNADTVTSFPEPSELPEPTPRMLPPVEATPAAPAAASPATQASPETSVPATPASPGTMRGPYPTAPGVGGPPVIPAPLPAAGVPASPKAATASHAMASTAGLGSAMREEVWAIVRAAVEEAVGPLVARQRELEARLERAEREPDAGASRARAAQPAPPAASAASRLASSGGASAAAAPTPLGPALLPAVFKPADPGTASLELPPAAVGPSRSSGASAHPVGPRPSVAPQGYGVSVMTSPRASLDLDAVGPVDVYGFDGGRRKRNVARVVVVLMLLLIGGAVTMMVLSYN
jgi:hypothetical protein